MKEVQISEKTYKLRKIGYIDGLELDEIKSEKGIKEFAKRMLVLGCEMSEEDVQALSLQDGLQLQKAINEYNSLGEGNFREPAK